uniref:GrpE protein homolog n=1 Tax=Syphacia muris TaxID=451379 RepID=A0A0N5AD30_9BILA
MQLIRISVGENLADDKLVIPRSAYDAIAGEYDEVCAEVAAFKDKYTRALAETENVRRRGVKQVEETKLFHLQKFSKDLIGVRDILDLAVQSVKKEDIDGDPKLKAFHEGIVMTCEVFEKTFRTHGIERLSPLGEKFNPNLHEAVFQVPKDKNKPGYVEEVMTIGYALHGRPIRAAKVAVVAE